MFRRYFLYNRSLLPKLSHCGWETIREVFQTTLARDDVMPGLVFVYTREKYYRTYSPAFRYIRWTAYSQPTVNKTSWRGGYLWALLRWPHLWWTDGIVTGDELKYSTVKIAEAHLKNPISKEFPDFSLFFVIFLITPIFHGIIQGTRQVRVSRCAKNGLRWGWRKNQVPIIHFRRWLAMGKGRSWAEVISCCMESMLIPA